MNENERYAQMIRTYRVTLDVDIYAASCDIKAVRLVETKNIKNEMYEPSPRRIHDRPDDKI